MSLHSYLPQDRLRALALGETLPERCVGAALFADISGFTALTEALTRELGERRGIEALSQRVNAVYEALIGEVERHGGAVMGFAGDAITCWFAGASPTQLATQQATQLATQQAAQCALAMQAVMPQFPRLSVKVAVGSGPARRFVIGTPETQLIDVLAGATVARAATAEGLAQSGEVLLDQASSALLQIPKGESREASTGERFFVLERAWAAHWPPAPSRAAPLPEVAAALLRPWVLPMVFERESAGHDLFSTDLRPATALFVRFSGLDFDRNPDAARDLASFVASAQALLQQHGGVLLELTIGDKGSYLYGNFGAAQVHEDDAARALRSALALRQAFAASPYTLQMGLSSGTLRVGGYGSRSRQSFGAMGDDVNSAARLMALALDNEILVSGRVRQAVGSEFTMEARPPMPLKGKAEPMPVFAVTGRNRQRAIRLQEPEYTLPMVGREVEAALLSRKLSVALRGQGQVLGIGAEAGMGKSRLVAEGIRLAHRAKLMGYGGACQLDGSHTPYLVWHSIWMAFFDLDADSPLRKQTRSIESQLRDLAPEHVEAWPLLGAALGLDWPDNDFTRTLQPKDRKELLETVLLQCLASAAREALEDGMGLLLVLEDLHALDPLSRELLLRVAQAAAHLPILILLSYRPPESDAALALQAQLEALHHFEALNLEGLNAAQCEQVIRAKLAGLFPEQGGAVPAALIERITTRAQGNPFFVEELLNYLHDRGIDPRQLAALELLELPVSLHSLVLSRIDQLQLSQQWALKVASVIGRLFHAAELHDYCPTLDAAQRVDEDLRTLARLGFTPQAPDEPELSYFFRHLVTLEASYASLAYASRQQLHGQYAHYLESVHTGQLDALAATLAHHYTRAAQHDKAWPYLLQAGAQAADRFANEEALSCFERALAWMPSSELPKRFELLLRREAIFDLLGDHTAQRKDLSELARLAERLAEQRPDRQPQAALVATRCAKLAFSEGDYPSARASSRQAIEWLRGVAGSETLQADALLIEARAELHAGDTPGAHALLEQALALTREHGLRRGEYNTLAGLGELHWHQGRYAQAEALFAQALALTREARDLRREIDMLNNLGVVAKTSGHFQSGIARYEEALPLARRIGDRLAEGTLTLNIGSACLVSGQFEQALERAEQAERLFAEVKEAAQQASALINWAEAHRELGQPEIALPIALRAQALCLACGWRRGELIVLENIGRLELALGNSSQARQTLGNAVLLAREIGQRSVQASAQLRLAELLTADGELDAARQALVEAEPLLEDLGDPLPLLELQAAKALLAMAHAEPALPGIENLLATLMQPPAALPYLPLGLHAAVHRVLVAAQDARASALLELARRELQARAARIARSELRGSYLSLPEHRQLLETRP